MYDYTGTLKVECEGQDFSQTYTFTEAKTVEVSIPTKRAGTFDVTITASDSQGKNPLREPRALKSGSITDATARYAYRTDF